MRCKAAIFLVISLFFLQKAKAQSIPAEIKRFNDGLPSDVLKRTVSDREGFLYIATQRGLCLYDGYHFLKHSSVQNDVQDLFFKNGKTYLFDRLKGLCRLDAWTDTARTLVPLDFTNQTANDDHFENIFVDSENRIWCTDFNYLKCFSLEGKKLGEYLIAADNKQIYDQFSYLEIGEKKELWIGSPQGLWVWSEQNKTLSKHENSELALTPIYAATRSGNSLFFACEAGKLWEYNLSENKITHRYDLGVSNTLFNLIAQPEQGQLSIYFRSAQSVFRWQNQHLDTLYTASNGFLQHIQFSKENSLLWVSSSKGLIKLDLALPPIQSLLLPEQQNQAVLDIREDLKGNLFLLTSDALWKYSLEKKWKKYTYPTGQFQSLSFIDNQLFIATNTQILVLKNEKLVPFFLPFSLQSIKKCLLDNRQRLWVMTEQQGVYVCDFTSHQELKIVKNEPKFWEGYLLNDMLIDNSGVVWLAGWMAVGWGLARYNPQSALFEEISKYPFNDKNNLIGDYYNRASLTAKGDLLFSGYGGWNQLNVQGKILKMVDVLKYKIANDHVAGIGEDSQGNVWFATGEGLHIYSPKTDQVLRLSQLNGLASDELLYGFRTLAGEKLAVGIYGGISLVDMQESLKPRWMHKLLVSQFKVNGKYLPFSPNITLEEAQTDISLLFSDLTYLDKQKVLFRYRFQKDKDWTYLGNNPELSFSHLAAGSYDLRIEFGDQLDHWQAEAIVLHIEVLPPFYKTMWFNALIILAVILFSFLITRYLLRQQKLKNELKEQVLEAEMSALRSQMNPHFMFNTLNSINRYIIENKKEDASSYLTTFSRLMRNVLENSQNKAISLKKELQTIELYLDLEAMRLEHRFAHKIILEEDIYPEELSVPPLILQPFLENAIWHGLRHKKENGQILISVKELSEESIEIFIEDNGIGRKAAAALKSSETAHKSFGMQITEERLLLHNPQNSMEIIDLYEGEVAMGTRVILKIQAG